MTSPQTDWKDRYFKAVNEFDEQERDWKERISRISRDLLRLLEGFRGHDRAFDRELDALAGARGDVPDYQARLSELVVQSALIAAGGDEDEDSNNAARLALVQLLDALVLPLSYAQRLQATRASLDPVANPQPLDDLVAVQQVAELLESALTQAPDGNAEDARDSLQTLLDHLSLPSAVAPRLAELTTALQAADGNDGLRPVAKDLANFLHDYIASIRSELAGMNGFLLQVKKKLDGVSTHLVDESSDQARRHEAHNALNEDVQLSLDTMRDQVDTSTDVQTLKAAIQEQISLLDGRIGDYLSSEVSELRARQSAHESLTAQVTALQQESQGLREKLVAAQARAASDALTGLPNRAAYDARLRLELTRRERHGTALSLVVVDLDKFKSINDTWGHQAGDRVLKHVARELRKQIRTSDFFARFGGEEFVLLLPETRLDGALLLAEGLRRHIDACHFSYKDSPVQVTISCGIAEFAAGDTAAAVFERADAALYAAKNAGRNCCITQS